MEPHCPWRKLERGEGGGDDADQATQQARVPAPGRLSSSCSESGIRIRRAGAVARYSLPAGVRGAALSRGAATAGRILDERLREILPISGRHPRHRVPRQGVRGSGFRVAVRQVPGGQGAPDAICAGQAGGQEDSDCAAQSASAQYEGGAAQRPRTGDSRDVRGRRRATQIPQSRGARASAHADGGARAVS